MNLSLLMTGISSSGKTTFLAALWELVNSREPLEGALRLRGEPADRKYFFEIGQTWLDFKELGHSNIDAPRHTEMPLVDSNDTGFDLRIPDIVGESFAQAWEGKDWPEEVAKIAHASNGLLIFVHGGKVVPPLTLPPGETPEATESSTEASDQSEWKASDAPTQTQLADLPRGRPRALRPPANGHRHFGLGRGPRTDRRHPRDLAPSQPAAALADARGSPRGRALRGLRYQRPRRRRHR